MLQSMMHCVPGCMSCDCHMQEEVMKVQSGVQLDLNLEKSRLKEEV